jgi:low temperature requirement protein LtrA
MDEEKIIVDGHSYFSKKKKEEKEEYYSDRKKIIVIINRSSFFYGNLLILLGVGVGTYVLGYSFTSHITDRMIPYLALMSSVIFIMVGSFLIEIGSKSYYGDVE